MIRITSSEDQPRWQRRLVAWIAVLVGVVFVASGVMVSVESYRYVNLEYIPLWTSDYYFEPANQVAYILELLLCGSVSWCGGIGLIVLGIREIRKCRSQPPGDL